MVWMLSTVEPNESRAKQSNLQLTMHPTMTRSLSWPHVPMMNSKYAYMDILLL